eukprot:CAMPEP_0173470682 /NCGR_PEP_ID=MMETSP1357-20121228/78005_1 /TAXON_ID=77926 /ORGANISM="Hemiselmis rufescens, Strain PCC563" /LENGTH=1276 /DNA_ID=CAMNT_0014438967 /DNA_START=139 /DNA_END=3966 /DNA_ORIENTATION=+
MISVSDRWSKFFHFINVISVIYLIFGFETFGLPFNAARDMQLLGQGQRPDLLVFFDYLSMAALFLEVASGCIAFGVWGSDTAYLINSGYHVLDFVLCVTEIGEAIVFYFTMLGVTLRPLRILRLFRLIRGIEKLRPIGIMTASVKEGAAQLMIVMLILLLFVATFSIFGMAVAQKSFRRRCILIDQPLISCSSDFSTNWGDTCHLNAKGGGVSNSAGPMSERLVVGGGYPFYKPCKFFLLPLDGGEAEYDARYRGLYAKDPFGRYHNCANEQYRECLLINTIDECDAKETQMCEEYENLQGGFLHFDHIGGAILAIFQTSLPDSMYDVLHTMLETEPAAVPIIWPLFILISILNTFLIVGLSVAVITDTFKRTDIKYNPPDATLEEEEKEEEEEGHAKSSNALSLKKIKSTNPDFMASLDEERPSDNLRHTLRIRLHKVLEKGSAFLRHVASIVIIIQAVSLFNDTWTSSDELLVSSRALYTACHAAFLADMIVALIHFGAVGRFLQSPVHVSELIFNISGTLGLLLGPDYLKAARVCRFISALRIYRLMIYFPTLSHLLISTVASTNYIFNLVIFIFVCAAATGTLGMYILGVIMDDVTRSNYKDLPTAFLTCFQLLTGDNWTSVMWAAMIAKDGSEYNGIGAIMFCVIFVLGYFIFCEILCKNLFVSVIIKNFEVTATLEDIESPGYMINFRNYLKASWKKHYKALPLFRSGLRVLDVNTGHASGLGGPTVSSPTLQHEDADMTNFQSRYTLSKIGAAVDDVATLAGLRVTSGLRIAAFRRLVARSIELKNYKKAYEPPAERVLFFLGPKNRVRMFFVSVGDHPAFGGLILICILVSCFFLFLSPASEDDPWFNLDLLPKSAMDAMNTVFTLIFTVEFVVRVLSQGLLLTDQAYLKSGWNIMDTVVLVFAWMDETDVIANAALGKVFRLARALRPLRLMKRNEGMRVIIDALIGTMGPVLYVVAFSLINFGVFALVGTGLFGGMMFACSAPGAEYPGGKAECSGTHVDDGGPNFLGSHRPGIMVPRAWTTPFWSFDSFASSVLTLFRLSTVKYVSVLEQAMDITEFDKSPQANASWGYAVFFVVFMLVGALFVMNIFVGFIVDGFNLNKGSDTADEAYGHFWRQIESRKPQRLYFSYLIPQFVSTIHIKKFIEHSHFGVFSSACVFINVGFMLADHADADESFTRIVELQNLVFFIELWVELLLICMAYGPGGLVNDVWKRFDVIVCLGTSAGYLFNNESIVQFVKAFRLMRVVRLMIRVKKIRIILETLIKCI